MKLYISVDLEGMTNVNFWHEIDFRDPSFEYHRKIVNKQIIQICNSLFKRYKELKKITICDSHAFGNNILYEELPENVELIRGFPRPYYMMEGLTEEYSGVLLLGYHSKSGDIGNLDHTYSLKIDNIYINGKEMSEFLINSYLAGEYGVPTIFTSGGNEYIKYVHSLDLEVDTLVTKEELGKFSSKIQSSEVLEKNIHESIMHLKEVKEYTPIKIESNLEVQIRFLDTLYAEVASWIPTVTRENGKTIRYSTKNIKEFYEILMVIIFLLEASSTLR